MENLKLDFEKINRDNGFQVDVAKVTTKFVDLTDINYSNTPFGIITFLGDTITPYEGFNYHNAEIGVAFYIKSEKTLDESDKVMDTILKLSEDVENLFNFDLEVSRIQGVETIHLTEISAFVNDNDTEGALFVKLKINYVN